jgi:hypothetical protein
MECFSKLTVLRIKKIEGPDIKEGFQDDFRQWYMEYKRVHGKYPFQLANYFFDLYFLNLQTFPDFPPEKVWQQADFKFGQEEKPATSEDADGEGKGIHCWGNRDPVILMHSRWRRSNRHHRFEERK